MSYILLDVEKLANDQVITAEQAEILRGYAVRDAGSGAVRFMVAFGLLIAALGFVALYPSAVMAMVVGVALGALGYGVQKRAGEEWQFLGGILLRAGVLALAFSAPFVLAGQVVETGQPIRVDDLNAYSTLLILVVGGWLAQSRLVLGLSGLVLGSVVVQILYTVFALPVNKPSIWLFIVLEPFIVVILYSIVAWLAWFFSKRLQGKQRDVMVFCARMGVLLVNIAFLAGVWLGDTPLDKISFWNIFSVLRDERVISSTVFVIVWAVVLILAMVWGIRHHRRFMVNSCAGFGLLLFFSKWFQVMGPTPLAGVLGGVVFMAIAGAFKLYNATVLEKPDGLQDSFHKAGQLIYDFPEQKKGW